MITNFKLAISKKNIFRFFIVPFLLLAVAAVAVYYITDYINRPRFVRYPAFGIDIPENFIMHGIDVSHHQENIDWDAVKAMQVKNIKIGFAFIKATEGLGRVDNTFRQNWYNAKQAAIPIGAYHYFNSGKSGKAQAENFIGTVNLQKGDLPPVLDIEETNGASMEDLQQRAGEWLQRIQEFYKVRPIIYTNVDFYENFMAGKFDDYPLWVAHYLASEKPHIQRNWNFWQHNEKGHVNGITACVDFNVFNGDSSAFRSLLIK